MRGALLLGGLLGANLAFSQPYDYGDDVDMENLTRRDDPTSRVIVGRLPLSHNGSVPLRFEIRQMRADTYKWDLFILALSMFQYVKQDDPTSWYQIAGMLHCLRWKPKIVPVLTGLGIHGVPFISWNGVEAVEGASQSGYCPHSSVLFPTWHRPYLALYEVSGWLTP